MAETVSVSQQKQLNLKQKSRVTTMRFLSLAAVFFLSLLAVQTAFADKIVIQDGFDFSGSIRYKDDGVTKIEESISRADTETRTLYRDDGQTKFTESVYNQNSRRKEITYFDKFGNRAQKRVYHFKTLGEVGSDATLSLIKQCMDVTVSSGKDSYTQCWEYDQDAQQNWGWHLKRIERGTSLRNQTIYRKTANGKIEISTFASSRIVQESDLSDEEKLMFMNRFPEDPSAPK
ncbi:MAG: hypothetical protein K2W82_10975 [Candidatus Obscuribacterales bacterium]|nr:hypothetical protein [Candidatus Obscuribacterales bacterium]